MEKLKISLTSGYLALLILLVVIGVGIWGIAALESLWFILLAPVLLLMPFGFIVVNPNESIVLILFGEYTGTVKKNGFFWVNPFYVKRKISLRARNFDSKAIKVNDKMGNPIVIGAILVWKVEDTFKAAFQVDNYEEFVTVQSEAAIRKLAGTYPYDSLDDHEATISLRSGGDEVNHMLEKELTERLEIAGIHVLEARISHLAYAQEIAHAMLQRQQATAIVAARQKIVEGAVGMVEMALTELSKRELMDLDNEKRAAMASNLMVVLCSDRSATPVVNAGTLHQ